MKACIRAAVLGPWHVVARGGILALGALLAACGGGDGGGGPGPSISVLSSRPDYVSAGDALLKVNDMPSGSTMTLVVNGQPQAATFEVGFAATPTAGR